MKGKCLIGTSGWHYEHWYGKFYPQEFSKERLLAHFSGHFNTVELNNTFYRLPKEKTVINWRDKVPSRFLFAVKASRFITHIKRLANLGDSLKVFLRRVYLLQEKLGPVLYQLPPSMKKNSRRLTGFFKKLPKSAKNVMEFRHQSWLDKEIFTILKDFNVAPCIISMPDFPVIPEITADFTYIRMHGSSSLYNSCYRKDELKKWALQIEKFLNSGKDTYVYFNNDVQGYAIANAQSLKKMLDVGA